MSFPLPASRQNHSPNSSGNKGSSRQGQNIFPTPSATDPRPLQVFHFYPFFRIIIMGVWRPTHPYGDATHTPMVTPHTPPWCRPTHPMVTPPQPPWVTPPHPHGGAPDPPYDWLKCQKLSRNNLENISTMPTFPLIGYMYNSYTKCGSRGDQGGPVGPDPPLSADDDLYYDFTSPFLRYKCRRCSVFKPSASYAAFVGWL